MGRRSELYLQLCNSFTADELHTGRKYIPRNDIDRNLTKKSIQTELERKNRSCLGKLRGSLADKIIKSEARKLFAILVCLSKADEIGKLLERGFSDVDLPLIKCDVEKKSKDGNVKSENIDVDYGLRSAVNPDKVLSIPVDWDWEDADIDAFLTKQWIVLPPVFNTSQEHTELNDECPLPFFNLQGIMGSNSNVVYSAEIHRDQQEGFEADAPKLRIALKEFQKKGDWENELDNLTRIRSLEKCRHITQSLATFDQGPKDKKKFYIIFPFAEGGDLDYFWQSENDKPKTPKLILWSLQQMLGLAEALRGLHKELEEGSERNCRHGDLKPGNILHFLGHEEGQGILKIHDFGISRIHNNATIARVGSPTEARATTPSYEAPEASPALPKKERSRKYDLWSLGCIYLEFVIWLVQDWNAMQTFTDARASDEKSERLFYQITNGIASVHPAVMGKLSDLKRIPQSLPGTALGDLLSLIEERLLVVDVEQRIDSSELCLRLQKIVEKAITIGSETAGILREKV